MSTPGSITSRSTSPESHPLTTERTDSSPSRLDCYAQCGLRYRFQYVEKRPSPPTAATTLGNIGHRGLELLFNEPQWDRTPERLEAALDQSVGEYVGELEAVFAGDLDAE